MSFQSFMALYLSAFIIPLVIIIFSLVRQRKFLIKPDMQFLKKDFVKTMVTVGLFGILVSFSGAVVINVDRIMIEEFLGLSATGIYATTFYFGVLIGIPARPLLKISSTVIAESWKKNDLDNIDVVYTKSCINQLIIGLLLFLGIWLNIHNVFKILPAEYEAGKYVILFIALTYLFEMMTGASTAVISTSKYYKYQAYFMIILIVLVVVSNIILIPIWGIVGAALASLFSKLITYFLRYIFIYRKFGLQPYNSRFLLVFFIGGITFLCGFFIPEFDNLFIDLLIRSSVIAIVFAILIFVFKPSEDVDNILKGLLSKIKKS